MEEPVIYILEQISLTQFVLDNADVHIDKIDGNNTGHAMDSIKCSTPGLLGADKGILERVKHIPCATTIGEFAKIAVIAFQKEVKCSL